jgi:hypothetical protein
MAYKCESALSSRNLPSSFVNSAAVERGLALSRYKYLQQLESLASPRVNRRDLAASTKQRPCMRRRLFTSLRPRVLSCSMFWGGKLGRHNLPLDQSEPATSYVSSYLSVV